MMTQMSHTLRYPRDMHLSCLVDAYLNAARRTPSIIHFLRLTVQKMNVHCCNMCGSSVLWARMDVWESPRDIYSIWKITASWHRPIILVCVYSDSTMSTTFFLMPRLLFASLSPYLWLGSHVRVSFSSQFRQYSQWQCGSRARLQEKNDKNGTRNTYIPTSR